MGREVRERPEHLANKLREIRIRLGLSQNALIDQIGLTGKLYQDYISGYERNLREPTLPVLLRYARLAGVSTDVLIDDTLKLPAKLTQQSKAARATTKKKALSK
jgi:transcriptional regulator with XRE-family HTH domain